MERRVAFVQVLLFRSPACKTLQPRRLYAVPVPATWMFVHPETGRDGADGVSRVAITMATSPTSQPAGRATEVPAAEATPMNSMGPAAAATGETVSNVADIIAMRRATPADRAERREIADRILPRALAGIAKRELTMDAGNGTRVWRRRGMAVELLYGSARTDIGLTHEARERARAPLCQPRAAAS